MAVEQAESMLQQARQALAQGNAQQARQSYLIALAERADSPDIHFGLATACFLLGDLETAAFHFKETTRLDPIRSGAYINLGAVYNRLENYEEAVKALRRGIQLDGKRAEAYYNLGLAYRRQGQLELAIQAYREAAHLNPRMADAHFNLGNLMMEMGRYSQAAGHFRQALEVAPHFEKARTALEKAEAATQPEAEDAKADTAETLQAATGIDLNRTVDPQADGPALVVLHKAVVDAQHAEKSFLKVLEAEVEVAIKELSSCLLTPHKFAGGLPDMLQKYGSALTNLRNHQKSLQQHMKKVREFSEKLLLG